MDNDEFTRHKTAVMLRRNDQPKKASVRANRLWNNEIYTHEYNFNRNEYEIEYLSNLKLQQIISFYYVINKYITNNIGNKINFGYV